MSNSLVGVKDSAEAVLTPIRVEPPTPIVPAEDIAILEEVAAEEDPVEATELTPASELCGCPSPNGVLICDQAAGHEGPHSHTYQTLNGPLITYWF